MSAIPARFKSLIGTHFNLIFASIPIRNDRVHGKAPVPPRTRRVEDCPIGEVRLSEPKASLEAGRLGSLE